MTDSRADRRETTEQRTSPVTFYRQVVAELRKVVWPTQEQLVTYFIVTLVFVAFFMTLVSLLDLGLRQARLRDLHLRRLTVSDSHVSETDHTDSQTNDVTEQQVSEQHDADQAEAAPLEDQPTTESDVAEDPATDTAEGDPGVDTPVTADEAETAESAEEPTETAEAVDPLEAFRNELWAKPGDWFVIHTYSGMEKRVKSNLENRIISLNMEDYIHEVVVPTEDVAEIKNGQRKMVNRTRFAGYVLVRMDLTDESWAAVRHTPSVTGLRRPRPPAGAAEHGRGRELAGPLLRRSRGRGCRGRRRRPAVRWRHDRPEAPGRGRRLRRVRLGDGRRRSVRHAPRHDHRDQRGVPEGQGPRRDLRPGDPGRAELQPDPDASERRASSASAGASSSSERVGVRDEESTAITMGPVPQWATQHQWQGTPPS